MKRLSIVLLILVIQALFLAPAFGMERIQLVTYENVAAEYGVSVKSSVARRYRINLWQRPAPNRGIIVAKLKPGTVMALINTIQSNGETYYLVETLNGEHRGWIKEAQTE